MVLWAWGIGCVAVLVCCCAVVLSCVVLCAVSCACVPCSPVLVAVRVRGRMLSCCLLLRFPVLRFPVLCVLLSCGSAVLCIALCSVACGLVPYLWSCLLCSLCAVSILPPVSVLLSVCSAVGGVACVCLFVMDFVVLVCGPVLCLFVGCFVVAC